VLDVPPPPPPDVPVARASAVALVRVRNVSSVPITITTNPDINEMAHAWRVNVGAERNERSVLYIATPDVLQRVKLFPIDLPSCDSDASVGFGGLGETRRIVLEPGATFDLGTWDGRLREEVVDPQRGVCLRESIPTPGWYRMHFDQPKQTRQDCSRGLIRWPIVSDGGTPVIELRCRPRPDGGPDGDEE
jgi:hypothetical protein